MKLEYKILKLFCDIESGHDINLTLSKYNISDQVFNEYVKNNISRVQIEGKVLFNLFKEIEDFFVANAYKVVNKYISNGRVFNSQKCESWNKTNKGVGKAQLFGTYIDIEDKEYLLHVCIGTTNVHIGFVKYELKNNQYTLQKLDSYDELKLQFRFSQRINGQRLIKRSWSIGWATFDCGNIYDFSIEKNFNTSMEFKDSELFLEYIKPLLALIKSQNTCSKLWIWKAFDKKQLWRFFVDGRFHKKYRGWIGYEENEENSTRGMLNGYSYVFSNFEEAKHLTEEYILNLHYACMNSVRPKNEKSTPGEYRYLGAGFKFFAKNSTINSLTEVFDIRKGDDTDIFFTEEYRKNRRANECFRCL